MTREIPRSRAALIAWTMLLTCLVAWIASFAIPALHGWSGIVYVRHGLEGAFVGGLCDAFAIWRVYVTIEQGYEELSREVSRFVVRDIVKPDNLVDDMRATLDAPATTAALQQTIQERFPSQERLTEACLEAWNTQLRDKVLERIVKADLHAWLDGPDVASAVLDDPKVRLVLRHCLSAAISDHDRARRLHHLIDLNWLFGKFFTKDDLLERLQELTVALDKPPQPGQTPAGTLVRDYAKAYLSAWSKLDETERREGTRRTLEILGPIVVGKIAELLWEQREDLVGFLATGAGISRHPFVEMVIAQLEPAIRRAPDTIEDALRRKLADLGGHGVRVLIERNTRERLDWIQFNGTLLGLVVGLGVGAVSALASYSF